MIPNILWQTWKTYEIPPHLTHITNSWNLCNPELKIELYSDQDCDDFIKREFGYEVYFLYSALPHSIMRADFWRVAVVYVYGGYYADLDLLCHVPLHTLIRPSVSAAFMKEGPCITNFFLAATPKHPALKLALDYMISEAQNVVDKGFQSFGMHNLHRAFLEHYQTTEKHYPDNDEVQVLVHEQLKFERKLEHVVTSITGPWNYESWRDYEKLLNEKRSLTSDILFFTTFNKNGYDLYGRQWIESFIRISNLYPSIKALIYLEDVDKIDYTHPNLTTVDFNQEIPDHKKWRDRFVRLSRHHEYGKIMTVRFSFKAFVIQDVLEKYNNDYLIWLDGDCVFKGSDYTRFPACVLENNFLACQVEENWDLNHVESGILIFNKKHPDVKKFNELFKQNYTVEELVPMGQPYDGFVIFKTLLMSNLSYTNLNQGYGRGGIQSDPTHTFLHPELKKRFVHNIGWTGKHQYENWNDIFSKDDIFKHVQRFLFGDSPEVLAHKLANVNDKVQSIIQLRQKIMQKRK